MPPDGAGVVGWNVHVDPDDDPEFIAQVDAGDWPVHETVEAPEWFPGVNRELAEGEYDIAVVAIDDAGNYSDPLSVGAWQNVPLDVTPPPIPTGGAIEFVVS